VAGWSAWPAIRSSSLGVFGHGQRLDALAPVEPGRVGEAGVITARFELPAGAEPAVLYVAEVGGGGPVPVAIP
jgi:hypothetical protein